MSSPVSTYVVRRCPAATPSRLPLDGGGLAEHGALLLQPAGVGDDEAGACQDRQEARVGLLVHQAEAVTEQVAEAELLDPVALGVPGRHDQRHGGADLVQHLEGLGEDRAVAQHLEPVERHEAERRRAGRWPGASPSIAMRSASMTVLAPVSTIGPRARSRAQVVDLVLGGREVQVAMLRHDAAVELLGHGVPDVAGAHAGLDVGHLGAQEAPDQGAEDGAEGVAVDDDERSGRARGATADAARRDGARRTAGCGAPSPGTCATRTTSRLAPRRHEVARPAGEGEVGQRGRQAADVEGGVPKLDPVAALLEGPDHRRQLDDLGRGPGDEGDRH